MVGDPSRRARSWTEDLPARLTTVAQPWTRATQLVAVEQRGMLQRALDQLSDEFRVPVVLRDVADLEYSEIAEILELAPGTVRSRISRGRSKLADLLDDQHQRPTGPGNRTARADVRAQDTP